MKHKIILFKNSHLIITEDTVFYSLTALLGPPIIWGVTSIVNPSFPPIWGVSCFFLCLDYHWTTYKNRTKNMLIALWVSNLFTFTTVLLVPIPLLRALLSLIGYLVYKTLQSDEFAPFIIGFVNIAVLTSSGFLGILGRDVVDSIIQIIRLFLEALVGISTSFIMFLFYHAMKKIFQFFGKRRKFHS